MPALTRTAGGSRICALRRIADRANRRSSEESGSSRDRHKRRRFDAPPTGMQTRGGAMRSSILFPLGMLGLVAFAPSWSDAATITGTVKGPDGAPIRAAFVQARHAGLKMTVSVLS